MENKKYIYILFFNVYETKYAFLIYVLYIYYIYNIIIWINNSNFSPYFLNIYKLYIFKLI